MSSELSPYSGGQLSPSLPRATASPVVPWTRQGRAIARADRATEVQARQDYNDARLAVHQAHLTAVVEKVRNQARAELTQDTLLHVRAIDDLIGTLSAGKPALELALRDIQAAHTSGEMQRILRRGLNL